MWVGWTYRSTPTLSAAPDLTVEVSAGLIDCSMLPRGHGSAAYALPFGMAVGLIAAGGPRGMRLLPAGVRTLSVELGASSVLCWQLHSTLSPDAVCKADAVQQLCELSSTAAESYREFRLASQAPWRAVVIELVMKTGFPGRPRTAKLRFENIWRLADALQDHAVAYGLHVSLSADQQCCEIVRDA